MEGLGLITRLCNPVIVASIEYSCSAIVPAFIWVYGSQIALIFSSRQCTLRL